jgi:preprotein translocase subunit SecE
MAIPGPDAAPSSSNESIMALSIYKPGQGYWTRVLTAIGSGTLVLAGALWVGDQLQVAIEQNELYWRAGVAVAIIASFGALIYYLLNKPRIVEFMIATETEMKKVNWPSRKEIIGSTIVVISGTLLLAAILFVINLSFGYLFQVIDVLETTGGG